MAAKAAATPRHTDAIEGNLSCPICYNIFTSPRLLPCLHTFCVTCIDSFSQNNQQCPICRQAFSRPAAGFPLNFIANNLVEDIKLKELTRQKKVFCDQCEEDTGEIALSRCLQCCENMCVDHTRIHGKGRKTAGHDVKSLQEIASSPAAGPASGAQAGGQITFQKLRMANCPTHTEEPLKLVCLDCNTPICRDCTLVAHRSHNFRFARELNEDKLKNVRAALQKAMQSDQVLADALVRADGSQATLQAHSQEARQQIDAAFNALAVALENRRQTLARELEALVDQEAAKFNAERKRLTTHRESLTRAQELAAQIAGASPELDIADTATQVLQQLNVLDSALQSINLNPAASGEVCFVAAGAVAEPMPVVTAIGSFGTLYDGNVDPVSYQLACTANGDSALVTVTNIAAEQRDSRINTIAAAPPQAFTVRVTGSGGEPDLQLQLRASDRDRARYQTEFMPYAGVDNRISACTSGGNRHVRDSPLIYTHIKFRFTSMWPSLSLNAAGQLVSSMQGFQYAIATPALPQTGVAFWAIDCVRNTSYWLGLGIVANPQPDANSYGNPTSFMWAGNSGQVYIRGINNPGHGGWSGFQDGDVAVFKLDMGARTLSMHVPRLRRTFSISIPASQQQYYIHVNLFTSGSVIFLRPATVFERQLL